MFVKPVLYQWIMFLIMSVGVFTTPSIGQTLFEDSSIYANDETTEINFGSAIALDGDYIAIGAHRDTSNGSYSGTVYVYSTSTNLLVNKLLPDDGAPEDWFGFAVDIDNGLVAVGARYEDESGFNSGSAYVFDAITGQQITKLTPPPNSDFIDFGQTITIHDGVVAVGAQLDTENGTWSGSVFLFDATSGSFIQKLLPSDGSEYSFFGSSIAINDDYTVIGAEGNTNENGQAAGAVYVFDTNTRQELFKFIAEDGNTEDRLGFRVDIHNNLIVAGAHRNDDLGRSSGSAYLFDMNTKKQTAKLLPLDGERDNFFGYSVGIHQDVVTVGAIFNATNGEQSGAVYKFDALTGQQINKLMTCERTGDDLFGFDISMNEQFIAVSAIQNDDHGANAGAVHLFDLNSCRADTNDDAELNFFDVSLFLSEFMDSNRAGDFNCDERFNFFDISSFLAAFSAGCQ
ncbi:MAG: hypothetical protein P1U42_05475 [Phycisphaerales bacterium]|nr:hypothetical protein [Phycisphaerales bacterium]